jgi:hypothetical protein
MSYSLLSQDLVEPKCRLREGARQMWARMRDEEQRMQVLEDVRLAKLHPWQHPVIALPMTQDMMIE